MHAGLWQLWGVLKPHTPISPHAPITALVYAGPLALKAGVWTLVEVMQAQGIGMLYTGPINTLPHVSLRSGMAGSLAQ